ncbi:hypothetical protein QSJ18_04920 [Gordonia sp. ABSL1-1]|uniref:hypothetical protein n=1 Tax=Gordonia sp. ABSL1-1 TaxID=3053923 RepID=UPI0025742574|nr:hypothetical protein [Gordonia sp. ABSL1-1]MDL9936074.1 hypothetical protein [Gordonia sp. ABSL1-1]
MIGRGALRPPRRFGANPLAVDSAALITTSALSAFTGIVFWTIAARLIPPDELGVQTAVLSLMTTAGAVAASGPGNAITAMLPATGVEFRRTQLVHAGIVVAAGALFAGTVAGVVGGCTIGDGSPGSVLLIIGGALVLALFAFKDTVLTALSAARRLPLLNLLISILKAVLLPLAVVASLPAGAVLATLVSAVVAVVVVVAMCRGLLDRHPPAAAAARPHQRRALLGFALRDGTASLVSMGTLLAAPFLTTWLAGPVQGAILALMLPIAAGLDFVSTGAAMALTKHLATAADQSHAIRRVWLLSQAAVALLGVILCVAIAPVLFGFFGHGYDHSTLWITLAVLCLGSTARVSFVVWAAVLRARLATRTLLTTNATACLVTVPVLVVCTAWWGSIGAAAGAGCGSAVLGATGAVGLSRTVGHRTARTIRGEAA